MHINISRASGVHEPMFSFSQSSFQQPQLLQQPPSKNDEEYRKLVKDLRRIYLAYAETIPPPGQPNVNQNSIVNQNCHFKAVVFKERARLEPLSRPEHMKDSENSKHAATWDAAETKLMESGLAEFYKPNVIYGVKNLLKKASEHNARFGNPKNSDRSDVFVKRLELARKQRTEQEGVSRKSEERLEKIRRKHMKLTEDLLEIMEKVELLRHLNMSLNDDERVLHSRIEDLSVNMRRSNAILSDLSASNAQSGRQVAQLQSLEQRKDDEIKIKLALRGQDEAIEKLIAHHRKDVRDIKIMNSVWRGS